MGETRTDTERRLRQRDLIAELGGAALRGTDIDAVLQESCRLVADGMGTALAKVLEYRPATHDLLVRAGVGWRPGVVGHATLGADDASPAGHALRTSQPVICNDLATEPRFRTPHLLLEHGVRRAINVIIQGDGKPFGVLEADCERPGSFLMSDIAFLQASANILGVAIERGRREAELREALEARDLLQREADHRIKNSLQLVASLLSLQRSRLADPEAVAAIDGAIARVRSVAEAHRALHQSRDLRTVAFGDMMRDICAHVGELRPAIEIRCDVEGAIELDAERAIPLALIVSELLTNAARHAYPRGEAGVVLARAELLDAHVKVEIGDTGAGFLPQAADQRTLGATIVRALSRQIGIEPEIHSELGRGTTVMLRLPLTPAHRGE